MGKKIQEFDDRSFIKKPHNPIVDSRFTIKLYMKRIAGHAESDTEDHSFDWTRDRVSADDKLKQIEDREKEWSRNRRRRRNERKAAERLAYEPEADTARCSGRFSRLVNVREDIGK